MNAISVPSRRTRLKICCIQSAEEARLAIAYGADAIGLVGAMPSGPGPIPDELIAEIAPTVPPPVATFLLTQETRADAIIQHVRRTGVNTVQLVDDDIHPEVYPLIRAELPAVKIVQVIHVRDGQSIEKAVRVSDSVDAILLDSGNPRAAIRELGGTGRIHDWNLSRQIVEQSRKPVFLAGGLNVENIATAVSAVKPYGIDVCSGVRQDGKLDEEKLAQFVSAINSAS